jgi:peroxiredoxin
MIILGVLPGPKGKIRRRDYLRIRGKEDDLKRSIVQCLILFAVSLSMFSIFYGCAKEKEETAPAEAPDFTLKTLEGDEMALSKLRGTVVLLDFWATWCAPCRESIPHLIQLHKTYQEKGFKVIGISIDKEKDGDALRHYVKSMDIPYPVVLASDEVTRQYGVSGIPATFLIDREGKIREKVVGFNDTIAEHLTAKVSELTEEKPQ